jgi:hypothetical protein
MQITANDIDRIEEAGMLDNNPVKLIRCKGGFWMALGKRKGKHLEEALAVGSHPAIVRYNLEKQYSGYQPAMMKSEMAPAPSVEKHSHFLSDELRKSGYDIFSIQTGPVVEFQITRQNACVASVASNVNADHLFIQELSIPKEFAKAMAGAAVEKALSCKVGLMLKK